MKCFARLAIPTALLLSTTAYAANNQPTQQKASFLQSQLNAMTNASGVKAKQYWYKHVSVSASLAVDAWAQKYANYLGFNDTTALPPLPKVDGSNSESAFTVGALNLNVSAQVNNWLNAHVNLFYAGDSQPFGISGTSLNNTAAIASASQFVNPTRYYADGRTSGVDLNEAYVNVGDFNKAPVMLRLGRQYLPFGQYDQNAISPSLTQQLSELRATALELAYVDHRGVSAAVYGFRGLNKIIPDPVEPTPIDAKQRDVHGINNFGAALGFKNHIEKLHVNGSVDYLYNMADVGDIAQYLNNTNRRFVRNDGNPPGFGRGYYSRVGAWAGQFGLGLGAWSFVYHHVASIGKFNEIDLDKLGPDGSTDVGASPEADTYDLSYQFKTLQKNSKLMLSYQTSEDTWDFTSIQATIFTASLALPKSRTELTYQVQVLPSTLLAFDFRHDTSYGNNVSGSGRNGNTGTLRLTVTL